MMYQDFYRRLLDSPLAHWLETLPATMKYWQQHERHGELRKWQRVVNQLPELTAAELDLTHSVTVGSENEASAGEQARIRGLLQQLCPWRKGPFEVFGVDIDTEWRSDWKWDRVAPHLSNLGGRTVLDIGCGSGYHLWRMKGAGADLVVGIDPGQLFVQQFQAIRRFMPASIARDVELLPLGIEKMPPLGAFDTVFTMGVLYHRRSPLDFLQQCMDQLAPGGELVLETLVVQGDAQTVLMPGERYAQMPNVWFLPSTAALKHWLERLGMVNVRVVDECQTTVEEQRATEWMTGKSLADFLDPHDPNLSIEGYPAPRRAVLIAERKA